MLTAHWSWSTRIPPWLFLYLLITAIVLWLVTVPPVSPAILVYSLQDAPFPFLVSPFSISTWTDAFSCILQVSWIMLAFMRKSLAEEPHPSLGSHMSLGSLCTAYVAILLARTGSGFLFSRSVGWAYPRLFSHYALYEPVVGLGPLIVQHILFGFLSPSVIRRPNNSVFAYDYANQNHIEQRRRRRRGDVLRVVAVAFFAFLEAAPWTYTCAAAVAGLHRLYDILQKDWQRSIPSVQENGHDYASVHLSVPQSYDMETLPPPSPHPRANLNSSSSRDSKLRTFVLAIVCMLLCWTLGYVPIHIPGLLPISSPGFRPTRPTWTSTSSYSPAIRKDEPQVPGMHIVMLTVPRAKDPSSDYMIDSVASYLDAWKDVFPASSGARSWSNTTSMLTIYAHPGQDGRHRGFERAESFFKAYPASSSLYLNFLMHPSMLQPPIYASWVNHYKHFADAIHYAYTAGYEWTMFVEDDFVLCGQPGAEGIKRVLEELRSAQSFKATRKAELEKSAAEWRGAWIGTGGSGLILHHTLLPTLAQLLEVIPSIVPTGAPYPLLPPDVLTQKCLYGDGLCGSLYPSLGVSSSDTILPTEPQGTDFIKSFPPSPYPPRHPSRRLITSRLLMGHIGGSLSTGGRKYSEGKWACGWRHPDHGKGAAGDVGVVVV